MKNVLSVVCLLFVFGLIGCDQEKEPDSDPEEEVPVPAMNSLVSIFEIPANDMPRAIGFYENILGVAIEEMAYSGTEMGLLPYENQMVTGVIIKGEGYQPSANGVLLYLNGGDNLQVVLDKVAANGGKIVVPKTPHADESGFFAIFLDSEGNRMGLHSPN